jgi:membrane-associated phospholipid phosphatase
MDGSTALKSGVFTPYRAVDYLTQGYILLVAVLVLFFHNACVEQWQGLVAMHLLGLAAIHGLIHLQARRRGAVLDLLRSCYPIILYSFLYLETHRLQYMFCGHRLDPFFIRLDQALFGCQLSRELADWLPQWWASELLYLSYFSYYIMVAGVGLFLYLRRRSALDRYVFVISFVFYICYLTYIFLPVSGPYDTNVIASQVGEEALIGVRTVTSLSRSGPFYRIMAALYTMLEGKGGAAFPSSHVAIAIATLCFTWRYIKPLRWVHFTAAVLLSVSTVYCGYHYAVDVLAGVVTAAVLVPVGEWLATRTAGTGGEYGLPQAEEPAEPAHPLTPR